MKAKSNTVDEAEVERFSRMADEWWNPTGSFKPLHQMNELRIGWIRDQAAKHFDSLQGLALLDIGCGGGLVAEPMARRGAQVTGIDASEKNIAVAKLHADKSGLTIDYRCTAAEDLLVAGEKYDIVLALEIIEHVADVGAFVAAACGLLKPGGLIIYSTLNRTIKSFAFAIVGAEYVLRWLPRGTHAWEKFLRPSELCGHLRHNNIAIKEMTGMVMHPLTWKWQLSSRDLDVNYIVVGTKTA
jgi:2-polyprenyl-6-hydroxyphenyl methylase / 3-demethylubiquinone-9 3-methyltransferase